MRRKNPFSTDPNESEDESEKKQPEVTDTSEPKKKKTKFIDLTEEEDSPKNSVPQSNPLEKRKNPPLDIQSKNPVKKFKLTKSPLKKEDEIPTKKTGTLSKSASAANLTTPPPVQQKETESIFQEKPKKTAVNNAQGIPPIISTNIKPTEPPPEKTKVTREMLSTKYNKKPAAVSNLSTEEKKEPQAKPIVTAPFAKQLQSQKGDTSTTKKEKTKTEEKKVGINDVGIDRRVKKNYVHMKSREEHFEDDIVTIAQAKNTLPKADEIMRSIISKKASVFAESETISRKIRKGESIEIIQLPKAKTTDLYYRQKKPGGILVRQEIKSITQEEAKEVNYAIINAEAQHKARLAEEPEPTWHKTILYKLPDNPWPYSSEDDVPKDRQKILEKAEDVVNGLATGNRQPIKEKMAMVNRRLGGIPPIESEAPESATKSKKKPKTSTAKEKEAATKKQDSNSDEEKVDTKKKKKSANTPTKTEDSKPTKALKVAAPWQFYARPNKRPVDTTHKAAAQNVENDPSTLHRLMIVTEQVIVTDGKEGIVLNRGPGGHFTARWQNDPSDEKTYRRHWNVEEGSRTVAPLDANENTRLHLAAKDQNPKYLTSFLKYKDEPNAMNKKGQTPLHLAAEAGNRDNAAILLKNKAEINAQDKFGNTPLHVAAKQKDEKMVMFLLEQGADPNIKNGKDGKGLSAAELIKQNMPESDILLTLKNNDSISM